MEYVKLGNSGLDVSRICLGCMSFGDTTSGFNGWAVDEDASREIIHDALELGINFFDTANCYSYGTSEQYLGRALKGLNRDEIVVATKVFMPMRQGANSGGLSRKSIMTEIDHSLSRLGLDYVDLYIIHRWDYNTPIEETMASLADVVQSGKARYIGASAMFAWQFEKAQFTADRQGGPRFVSMQNHYNLLYREDEREMLPLCRDEGIASTPYSPLAAGRLARRGPTTTKRTETDDIAVSKYGATEIVDAPVIERVAVLAERYGATMSQISLAWLLRQTPVVAPIIGATKASHVEEAVGALSVTLSDDDAAYLEEPYVPHKVVGALSA